MFVQFQILGMQIIYSILFGLQCAKLTLYGVLNLAAALIYLFIVQLQQISLRAGKKLLRMPL
jgi:hypothetical protein